MRDSSLRHLCGGEEELHRCGCRITGVPFSLDAHFTHLLDIPLDRVVPTPLHVFLGIGNYILEEGLTAIFNKKIVEKVVSTVKTTHSPGHGGLADIFNLNGQELSKFIKRDCFTAVRTAAVKSGRRITRQIDNKLSVLGRWMKELHDNLLHSRQWTDDEISHWRTVVDEIQQGCKEFINKNKYHFLGKFSEAQIESHHATYNIIYEGHKNQSQDTPLRMRRTHADLTLTAIQPVLTK